MININFRTKTKNATTGYIEATIRVNGQRKRISTGISVPVKYWDQSNQKLKRNGEIDHVMVNRNVEGFKDRLQHIYMDIEFNEGSVTAESFIDAYKKSITKKKPSDFMSYLSEYWQTLRDKKQKNWKSYRTTYNIMVRFVHDTKYPISWQTVDLTFYNEYIAWFYDQKYYSKKNTTGKSYSKNYLGAQIKNIKAIMTNAWEEELHTNVKYKYKGFKKQQEKIYNIYYDMDELERMHKYHFEENRLEQTKDRFLIGCFTGLRFADLSRLGESNIRDGFIIQDTSKTNDQVTIPIHWIVRDILIKYNGKFPADLSNQKMNLYLKEATRIMGFNQMITKYRTEGGEKERRIYPKYQLTTTHTMRRSLASNMYLSGIPLEDIMPITGHKKPTQLLDYIKVEGLRRAQKLETHPFYNEPTSTEDSSCDDKPTPVLQVS